MPTLEGIRVSPIERKLRYIDGIASDRGIDLSSLKWGFELPKIFANSEWAVYIRLLLDLDLVLSLHFPPLELKFALPDFPAWLLKIDKARYGISKYDESIYDPEQVSPKPLENLLWDFHYKALRKCTREYKLTGKALQKYANFYKNSLIEKEVRDYYVEDMFTRWAVAESKAIYASYVGFAVVGIMIVTPPRGSGAEITLRRSDDWKTKVEVKSYQVYEGHVGFVRVGYFRVVHKKYGVDEYYLKSVSEEFKRRIEDFHNRIGGLKITVPYPKTILGSSEPPPVTFFFNMQRLLWHQRTDRMHYKGGEHQLQLQNIIIRVKKILNRKGIVAQQRLLYLNFAQEYVYLYHPTEEEKRPEEWGRSKEFKKIMEREEVVKKYKELGADESILREIIDAINLWATAIPPP